MDVTTSNRVVTLATLPRPDRPAPEPFSDDLLRERLAEVLELRPTLQQLEDAYLQMVIDCNPSNLGKAAEVLGIDASTLYRKRNRLGLLVRSIK